MKGLTSQPQPLQPYEVSQVATSSRSILPHANKLTPPAIYPVVREMHPLLGVGQSGGSEAQRALPLTLRDRPHVFVPLLGTMTILVQ